jgi:hypothetical protein
MRIIGNVGVRCDLSDWVMEKDEDCGDVGNDEEARWV